MKSLGLVLALGVGAFPLMACSGSDDTSSSDDPSAGGSSGSGGVGGSAGSDSGGAAGSGGSGGSMGGSGPVEPQGTPGCGAADWPIDGRYTIDVAGTPREYILRVPPDYDPSHHHELLFVYHGLGMNMDLMVALWENLGSPLWPDPVITVVPNGLDSGLGGGQGWPNVDGQDVEFTHAMLDQFEAEFCIDETRVFSTGVSFGGIMSNFNGCFVGDRFRAIAPLFGSGPELVGDQTCVGDVAVWTTHGRADTTLPFPLGEATRDFWVAKNGCSQETVSLGVEECVEYQGCREGFPVVWCPHDGGHLPTGNTVPETVKFFDRF